MGLSKRLYVNRDVDIPITAENLNDIQDEIIHNTSYAVCSSTAATAAKTVTISNFLQLSQGCSVKVKFTASNTAANPSLNVNGTGAKSIMKYGTTPVGIVPSESWEAGEIVTLVYDGTYWLLSRGYSGGVRAASYDTSITPNTGSNYSSYGESYYYKKGTRVHVHLGLQGLTAASANSIITLPSGYRPRNQVAFKGIGGTALSNSTMLITSAGVVTVYPESGQTYACVDADFDAYS